MASKTAVAAPEPPDGTTEPTPGRRQELDPVAGMDVLDEWARWRYDGPTGRIYTNIPVTPDPGDVIAWCDDPGGDGAWTLTADPVSRRPDNWVPDLPDADPSDEPPATPDDDA